MFKCIFRINISILIFTREIYTDTILIYIFYEDNKSNKNNNDKLFLFTFERTRLLT